MSPETLEEQLVKYLTDAHSIEQQAIAQLKMAPKIAGDEQIATVFSDHLRETEDHRRLVDGRLQARGATASTVKDVAGTMSGTGFGLFALAQTDTPGKLIVHAYSYEHMEEAAYDLLRRLATRAGDAATAEVAQRIGNQEHAMGDRLASCFDRAVDASLANVDAGRLDEQLDIYLEDAHAIEGQSLNLLDRAADLAGDPQLTAAYSNHRAETKAHRELTETALLARGDEPSRLKDAALALGALNWGTFFSAQPDTPAKLAAFVFAVEHLEIAAYECLRRVAARVGDPDIEQLADSILVEEHAAATQVRSLFDNALQAGLAANVKP